MTERVRKSRAAFADSISDSKRRFIMERGEGRGGGERGKGEKEKKEEQGGERGGL